MCMQYTPSYTVWQQKAYHNSLQSFLGKEPSNSKAVSAVNISKCLEMFIYLPLQSGGIRFLRRGLYVMALQSRLPTVAPHCLGTWTGQREGKQAINFILLQHQQHSGERCLTILVSSEAWPLKRAQRESPICTSSEIRALLWSSNADWCCYLMWLLANYE